MICYTLRGEHAGCAYALAEASFRPGAQGTPLHIHTREEETYNVIEGALRVGVGDEELVLGPGDSVVLPRNIKHKVTPGDDTTTRAPMIVTPPTLEGMLMRLDDVEAGQLDMSALLARSNAYGVRILPEE